MPVVEAPAWQALGWQLIRLEPAGMRSIGEQALLEWNRGGQPPEPKANKICLTDNA